MPDKRPAIAIVVPTKDRPEDLLRLLRSIAGQSCLPAEVIVVDGGEVNIAPVLREPSLSVLVLRYERCRPPSASRQRNWGLRLVSPDIPLIGFLDDDCCLEPDALARMLDYWATAGSEVGGASFNLLNHPAVFAADWKRRPWVERLGLYSGRPGAVLPSGFQVMIGRVDGNLYVRWMGTGASVWRRSVFEDFAFDEWYTGYSYLEDLDFSYRVGRRYRLAVVAGADYRHFHALHGRGSGYVFGLREAANRIYFVRKNPELSLARCLAALSFRTGISLIMALRERRMYYVSRAAGTVVGMVRSLFDRRRPRRNPEKEGR